MKASKSPSSTNPRRNINPYEEANEWINEKTNDTKEEKRQLSFR